jgi:CHAT domain-containing protein
LLIGATDNQRLAAVAEELSAINNILPQSTCMLDDPQTMTHVFNLSQAPIVLHIAAHSELREDAPIFSSLRLHGEFLTVEQCYELPLTGTQLVTLSACTTATGMDSGGSLLAFQSAFLVAGARHILSTLWPIDDQSAVLWMQQFYRYIVAGYTPPAALRQTQILLLTDHSTDHPAIWAAYICSSR